MTFVNFHPRALRHQAFTLVELLAAMAVLSLLVVMMGQIVSLASKSIEGNSKSLDAASQARAVFDRLGMDLAARPRRTDLGMLFTKASVNDSLQFYSAVDGYTGTRQIAWVGYRIQQTTTGRIYQLERGASGTTWSAGTPVSFLPESLPLPDNNDYEVLAPGIFRLEFCYLLNTGAFSNSANSDYTNVVAIVVAVAVLDNKSRAILSDANLAQLSQNLPDTTDGNDPLSGWNAAVTQGRLGVGIPSHAVSNVRFYQRIFYVQ